MPRSAKILIAATVVVATAILITERSDRSARVGADHNRAGVERLSSSPSSVAQSAGPGRSTAAFRSGTAAAAGRAARLDPRHFSGARVALAGVLGPLSSVRGARVERTSLTAAELSAPMPIAVSLRLRSSDLLEAELSLGHQIGPAKMESDYLPLASDYEATASWLADEGFTLTESDPSHTTIYATGTASQVAQAFGVELARVSTPAGEFTAAITEPSLPAELAGATLSVNGLQPYRLAHHAQVKLAPAPAIVPLLVYGSYMTPWDVEQQYGLGASPSATGQTIAVIMDGTVQASDFNSYCQLAGINQTFANTVTIVPISGGWTDSSSGAAQDADGEATQDVETSAGGAPGAKVRFYEMPGLSWTYEQEALTQILADAKANNITVVTMSFGATETESGGTTQVQAYSQQFQELAAAGVTCFAASGDGGSNPDSAQIPPGYSASEPLAVSYPASDPYVTGVGGTVMTVSASDLDTRASEAVWGLQLGGSAASGGGVSTAFSKPIWQSDGGAVLTAATMRCVPDLAAPAFYAATGFVSGFMGSDQFEFLFGTTWGSSGTSVSSPLWAGMMAVVNAARAAQGKASIGLLGPAIYPAHTDFFPITSGNNGAYSAQADGSYNLCTGLGSPNFNSGLLAALVAYTAGTSPAITTQPSGVTVTAGNSFSLSVAATGSGTLFYQWELYGSAISGATTTTYTVSSASASDSGSYTCVVSNEYGAVSSNAATVTVNAAVSSGGSSSGGGGGGGGGGAPSDWFLAALAALGLARLASRRGRSAIGESLLPRSRPHAPQAGGTAKAAVAGATVAAGTPTAAIKAALKLVRRILASGAGIALGAAPITTAAAASENGVEPTTTLTDSVLPADPSTGQFFDRHHHLTALAGTIVDQKSSGEVNFHVALKMRNLPELRSRIARGEILSQAEMAAKYYPLAQDWMNVAAWLSSNGLQVTPENPAAPIHLGVIAHGSVDAVSRVLGITFAAVEGPDGRIYNSAVSAPRIPTRLAATVIGITGLQPQIQPRPQANIPVTPDGEAFQSGGVPYNPPVYYQTFGPLALLNYYRGLSTSHGGALNLDGSGQTIAIMMYQDDIDTLRSDLVQFWAGSGLSHTLADLTIINPNWYTPVSGQNAWNNGIDVECTIDLEWASGMAEGAQLRLYECLDPSQFVPQIIADKASIPGLNQASMSSGYVESQISPASENSWAQYYAALAAAGVTMFAPSGDSGSNPDTAENGPGYPTLPLGVLYPACDPSVVAVGGTCIYFLDVPTEGIPGGIVVVDSTDPIGEAIWPDSGGGYSQVFERPSWQIGLGPTITANVNGNSGPAMRTIPDVAAVACNGSAASFYTCEGGINYTGAGTSFSSPIWAGICAILNQARAESGQPALGLLTPKLYAIASSPFGAAAIDDIPPLASAPFGGDPEGDSNGAYLAQSGYDLITGLGTPNITNLCVALVGYPAITDQPQSATLATGSSFTLSVNATGAAPLTYQWSFNGTAIAGATASTYSVSSAEASNFGAYTVVVSNSYGFVESNTATVAIGIPPAIGTQPQPTTVTTGSSINLSVLATGSPTLTYQWSLDGAAIAGATSSAYSVSSATSSNAGFYSVVVSNAFGSVTSSTVMVTVNAPTVVGPAPSGGGGGGGGAPSYWLYLALAALVGIRRMPVDWRRASWRSSGS